MMLAVGGGCGREGIGLGKTDAHTHAGPFDAIAARAMQTCAVRRGGELACWGQPTMPVHELHRPPTDVAWTSVSLGNKYGCGVRADQTVRCFGGCFSGHCQAPTGKFETVAAGEAGVACAIDELGTLACWGDQVGMLDGAPGEPLRKIAIAPAFACAVTKDEAVRCWGQRAKISPARSVEVDLIRDIYDAAPDGRFVDVAVASFHACAVEHSGKLVCWGGGVDGQTEPPTGSFVAVAADASLSCAVRDNGKVQCWGWARPAPPDGEFVDVAVGRSHACARRGTGEVVCWGKSHAGQTRGKGPGPVPPPGEGQPPVVPTEGGGKPPKIAQGSVRRISPVPAPPPEPETKLEPVPDPEAPPADALDPFTVISRDELMKRWRGAWTVPSSEGGLREGGWGAWRVFALRDGVMSMVHAPWEREERTFEIKSPCRIRYAAKDGNGQVPHAYAIGSKTGVGDRPVGYRAGTKAVVCVGLTGVITVDNDRCWWWQRDFVVKPSDEHPTCTWDGDALKMTWVHNFMRTPKTENATVVDVGNGLLALPEDPRRIRNDMVHYDTIEAAERALCGRKKGLCTGPVKGAKGRRGSG